MCRRGRMRTTPCCVSGGSRGSEDDVRARRSASRGRGSALRGTLRALGAVQPQPAPRRAGSPLPRVPHSPLSTLNRRIKHFKLFVRIRFFFRPLVNFFRVISPLFRLPEMSFFRFRRTDRARCALKSCLIF